MDWLEQLAALANPQFALDRLNNVSGGLPANTLAMQNEMAGWLAPVTNMQAPSGTPQAAPGGMVPANPNMTTFGPQPGFGDVIFPQGNQMPFQQMAQAEAAATSSSWPSDDEKKKKLAALNEQQQALLNKMMPQQRQAPSPGSASASRGLSGAMAQAGPTKENITTSIIPTLAMLLAGQPYRRQ